MTDTQIIDVIATSLATGATKIRTSHLDRYDFLRGSLLRINVTNDEGFQKTYSSLFQMRHMPRPTPFAQYFALMEAEKVKVNGHSFEDLLVNFREHSGRWEVSFISKLIAIIDPNRSVWDSLVSRRLGLKLPIKKTSRNCSAAYASLEYRMNGILKEPGFQQVSHEFAQRFPGRHYPPMRILDATIWGLG